MTSQSAFGMRLRVTLRQNVRHSHFLNDRQLLLYANSQSSLLL